MKLNINSEAAVGSGLKKISDFRMNMNAKAARVLSDSLYKDSHGSIIRELSCNAYDAHCMVGKENEPFLITLPDRFSSELRIRDYGPGISPEDINDVYAVYFASTKDQDNDAIGAFGLGSKTPFSLTDSFMVVSIHKGVKRTYNAYMDSGMPAISQFGEAEETDEPDGLEVVITVSERDSTIFRDKVVSELRFFPVKPKVVGQQINWPEVKEDMITVDGFRYFHVDSFSALAGFNIKIGPVAYPIDFKTVKEHYARKDKTVPAIVAFMESKNNQYRNTHGGYIDMPIGTVEVTPSRESLSYSEFTLNNIETVIDRISGELFTTIRDTLHKKYNESYPAFIEYFNSLDKMLRESVDAKYVEKHFSPFVIDERLSQLSLTIPESIAHFYKKVYVGWRGKPELNVRSAVNRDWETHSGNYSVDPKTGDKIPHKFEHTQNFKQTLVGFVNTDAPIYIKDESYAFAVRCYEDFNNYVCQAREYFVLENDQGFSDLNGLGKYLKKYLGNDRVKYISETDKVSVHSGKGHSTTGGKTRSWFDIDYGIVHNLMNTEAMFNRTLYKLNANSEFEQTPNDLEQEYGKDEVVFFTAYNNKLDRPEQLPDATALFNYLFNVLDARVIAVPRNQAKKFSKLNCAINVCDLIEQNRDEIVDKINNELDALIVKRYNQLCDVFMDRGLLQNARNFLSTLSFDLTVWRSDNISSPNLEILRGISASQMEPVLEALDAEDILKRYLEGDKALNSENIADIEAYFKKYSVDFESFIELTHDIKETLLDPANTKTVLSWAVKNREGKLTIFDPMEYRSYMSNDSTKVLFDFDELVVKIIDRVA